MAAKAGGKDFYKVLNVKRTSSKSDIKAAYRKLALALHPDRHDGCDMKADEFKDLNEAYDTLSDHAKRTAYDNITGGLDGKYNKNRRKPPPSNYRKVYSPQAPPGFKTFDEKRHFDMHYGEGMMKEEIELARKRAEAASSRFQGYEYESPLGKGFTFDRSFKGGNPYSKRPQGPPKTDARGGGVDIEYEESHYYDLNSSNLNQANRVIQRKEVIKNRMDERRKNRRRQRGDPLPNYEEESGCVVM